MKRLYKTHRHPYNIDRASILSFYSLQTTLFDSRFTSLNCLKEVVSLHFQPKVRFRKYFEYFLMKQKSFKKSTIRKLLEH